MAIMFGEVTYLIWLAIFIGAPILFLCVGWGARLWAQRRALALTTLGALIGGWAWDALAVRAGLWQYDPSRITGLWFIGLPLEEWLWIIGVTLMFGGLTVVLADAGRK